MSERPPRSLGAQSLPYTPVRSTSSASQWSFQSLGSSPWPSDSESPVRTRRKRWKLSLWSSWLPTLTTKWLHYMPSPRLFLAIILAIGTSIFLAHKLINNPQTLSDDTSTERKYQPIRPELPPSSRKRPDPAKWLEENSNDKYSISNMGFGLPGLGSSRPKAALISLVRNSELVGIMQSMRQLEYRWNHKYQYPWIFFNDEPFTEEFKSATRNLTNAEVFYEIVPKEHWSLPDWIDEGRFMNSLEYLGTIGVGKGWMVHYFCDINYDIFRFMSENKLKYGFNMNILDDARSFPSLWSKTRSFVTANPHLLHPDADLAWLLDPKTSYAYNNCQFFSNFEIGSLNFWREKGNEAYFEWLDRTGGFYYERFGDAPVHTLSVGLFAGKEEVWWFRDIGYQHDINHHCPKEEEQRCTCEPTRMDEGFYKLVPLESPQKKPDDSCIRMWLGGKWVEKKEGWTMEGEKAFGGDGYHGYVYE